jgi:ketol-acid reductoisomerase
MVKTWKDSDISLDPLKDQTIAIIGYGIQGDAQANNLKDSGLNVIVGLKEGGTSWNKAKNDGHEVMSVAEACKKADIIHILIPDMVQSKVYREEIEPNLESRYELCQPFCRPQQQTLLRAHHSLPYSN